MGAMANVVIVGGGPGGYEAAMVAAQLGGSVTLIEDEGMGGSAVLTDVVPSKSLIATAEVMARVRHSRELGLVPADPSLSELRQAVRVDLAGINERLLGLAAAQSHDIAEALALGDQIVVLAERGRIAQQGTGAELIAQPADEFVADFLGLGAGRGLHLQDSDGTQLVMDADGRPIGRLSGHRR